MRDCPCTLLMFIAKLSLTRNWSCWNSKSPSLGMVRILEWIHASFLPTPARTFASVTCGRCCWLLSKFKYTTLEGCDFWEAWWISKTKFKRVEELKCFLNSFQNSYGWTILTICCNSFEFISSIESLFGIRIPLLTVPQVVSVF